MHLLFYKSASNLPYEISIEVKPDITNEGDYELLLNSAQVEKDYLLRTILSFEDTYSRNHFLVL